MSSLSFPTRFRGKPVRGITFIGDIATEFLCGPRCFLLVHCKFLIPFGPLVWQWFFFTFLKDQGKTAEKK
jgi:hypothetical protein